MGTEISNVFSSNIPHWLTLALSSNFKPEGNADIDDEVLKKQLLEHIYEKINTLSKAALSEIRHLYSSTSSLSEIDCGLLEGNKEATSEESKKNDLAVRVIHTSPPLKPKRPGVVAVLQAARERRESAAADRRDEKKDHIPAKSSQKVTLGTIKNGLDDDTATDDEDDDDGMFFGGMDL